MVVKWRCANQYQPPPGRWLLIPFVMQVWENTGTWVVSKRGSPGNVSAFRDFVVSEGMDDTMSLLCVAFARTDGAVIVGAAVLSTVHQSVRVYEFIDPGFAVLRSLAVQENAKECVVPAGAKPRSVIRSMRRNVARYSPHGYIRNKRRSARSADRAVAARPFCRREAELAVQPQRHRQYAETVGSFITSRY